MKKGLNDLSFNPQELKKRQVQIKSKKKGNNKYKSRKQWMKNRWAIERIIKLKFGFSESTDKPLARIIKKNQRDET